MNPKILLVDDEDSILSAAKRLFRGKNLDIITASSPVEAFDTVIKENISVVISDFRMPQMTGTEFLEKVRQYRPEATRMMLTGFLEMPIIQEAVNRAHVFRFISKPWDDQELVLGVETALKHHRRHLERNRFVSEISQQNIQLEALTTNLETEVLERTKGIEESTIAAQDKQRLVREITGFVKSLSRSQDVAGLAEVVFQEVKKFRGVSTSALLVFEGNEGRLFWLESRNLLEKRTNAFPSSLFSLKVTNYSLDIAQWMEVHLKRDIRHMVAFPLRARDVNDRPAAVLFLESANPVNQDTVFLERVTDRIQPVSVVLDRILLHDQIEKARMQWEATFNGFNDPIAVVDSRFQLVRSNNKFTEVKQDLCHKAFADSEHICSGCPLPKAVQFMDSNSELIRVRNQQTYRVHSFPIRSSRAGEDKVERVVNYYTDLSRERELYMKLVQSEKLAAIGLLAGNIAHELNNPLTGIRAMSQVLQKEMGGTNSLSQDLREIENASKRCQDIIENLLNFSNPAGPEVAVNINEIVTSTLPLLKAALRMQNLHTDYAKGLPLVKIRFSQLQQVIFNLVNNACQAMTDGGTLVIKTEKRGANVCISVSDNGPGIPKELHGRIFESFFTTKGVGQGTGLGLSVSKSIVERSGGRLLLESEPGKGTTFIVSLPPIVEAFKKR